MEYIERDNVISELKNLPEQERLEYMGVYDCVKSAPTADVVEVKCSNWGLKSRVYKMLDDVDEEFYVECPLCHRTEYVPFELEEEKMLEYARKHYPYCHCGAKMDGKDGE